MAVSEADLFGLALPSALIADAPRTPAQQMADEVMAVEADARRLHARRLRVAVAVHVHAEQRLRGAGALAPLELAFGWGVTESAAQRLTRQALQVVLVVPAVLQALEDAELGVGMCDELLDTLYDLRDRPDLAAGVADQVLDEVRAARLVHARAVARRARQLVDAADPGAAEARRRGAKAARDVVRWSLPDGMASLVLTASAAQIRTIMSRVAERARELAHDDARDLPAAERRTAGQLRSDAMVELLRQPSTPGLPQNGDGQHGDLPGALITVPVQTVLGVSDDPAVLHADSGPSEPMTAEAAREVVAGGAELVAVFVDDETGEVLEVAPKAVRPGKDPASIRAALLDMLARGRQLSQQGPPRWPRHPDDHPPRHPDDHPPRHPDDHPPRSDSGETRPRTTDAGQHPVGEPGAYRPPRWMRRLVKVRSLHCEFPGCALPAVACDLDHDRAWPGGPTCPCNLGPCCRHHHRIKQSAGWTKSREADGSVRWTSPLGLTAVSSAQTLPLGTATRALPELPEHWSLHDPDADDDPRDRTPEAVGDLDVVRLDDEPRDTDAQGWRLATMDGGALDWALLDAPDHPVDWTLDGETAVPRVLRRGRNRHATTHA